MIELTRELVIYPAYDHRPEGGGQHGVEMRWYVRGPKGVIQFVLYTGWPKSIIATPDTPWDELYSSLDKGTVHDPLPADLGYHSHVPMYEGQELMDNKCQILGGPCYYDGSGLNANRIFSILVHEGGEAVWAALEKEYAQRFAEVAA